VTTEPSVSGPLSPEITQIAERHGLGRLHRAHIRQQTVDVKHPEHYYTQEEVTSHFYEFEHGLIYQRNEETPLAYPWKDVSRVYVTSTRNFYNGAYTGTDYSGVLVLTDGGSLRLHGKFHDPAYRRVAYASKKRTPAPVEYELFKILSAASTLVSQLRLPDALASLERGEALPFGDISISLAGVQTGKGLVPWNSIKDIKRGNGVIRVEQAGKFRPISHQHMGSVPNLPLFLTLVDAIRKNQRQ
jgi:hypothetical protein